MLERLLRIDRYVILTFLLVGGEAIHYFIPDIRSGNWSQALEECSRYNLSLPIIRNGDEQEALFQYLKTRTFNIKSHLSWIAGKEAENNNWTWIDGQTFRFKEGTTIVREQTAATLEQNLEYEAQDPREQKKYICQFKPNDTKCTEAIDERVRLKNGCVIRESRDYLTWFEARNDCLEKGGDLPVLGGIDLDILNRSSLWEENVYPLWLGLRKSSWIWYSNNKGSADDIKYSNWFWGHPDLGRNDCLAIDDRDGEWRPKNCSSQSEFLCENRAKSPDITETLTSGPTIETLTSGSTITTFQLTSDLASEANSQVTTINHSFKFKVYAWLGITVAFIIICI